MTAFNIYNDYELFQHVQAGNVAAFDTLYERYFEQLYKAAFRRLKDQSVCKDIVQDVFLIFGSVHQQYKMKIYRLIYLLL